MASPQVVSVVPDSPAGRAGVVPGDRLVTVNGQVPRDVIQYQLLVDEPELDLDVDRGGLRQELSVVKQSGEPLGIEVEAAIFDQVRTCDNHCAFCFIYQLPPGMRRSLYLKDDDYRLSFLYGNFTTLTRFTEADLERVVTERLSPLYVSIHATDRATRSAMLRNRRGGTSLRWLRALLDAGIEVHGQIVVCPGINDGAVLEDTLLTVLDVFPELRSLAVVPLGISDHSSEPDMRFHTEAEAEAVVDLVEQWQRLYLEALGRRLVFAADEYYLLATRPFPPAEHYDGFAMHEDGIGMARTFELEFTGATDEVLAPTAGFFAWVDGAPASGYRAPRSLSSGCGPPPSGGSTPAGVMSGGAMSGGATSGGATSGDAGIGTALRQQVVQLGPRSDAPVGIVTGTYGARVLDPLLTELHDPGIRLITVENRFFGGNIGVTGLLVGADIARALAGEPVGHRYLLPDVCLSGGRFLDGTTIEELPRPVEVIGTDGHSLRRALAGRRVAGTRSDRLKAASP